ncbi:MAG: hypothetical protein AB1646_12235 [Thermodesulfobacteriota bacterium]
MAGIIALFLVVTLVILWLITGWLSFSKGIFYLGFIAVGVITYAIIPLVLPPEICGNGVWRDGRFHPWDDFAYFVWRRNEECGVELSIEARSSDCSSAFLAVPHEDCEAVQQLLKANLPDRSLDSEAYLA